MRLSIDGAEQAVFNEALATGRVYGVTTNPTLLLWAGVTRSIIPNLVHTARAAGAQEIHLQTFAETAPEIVAESHALVALDPMRILAKIPATPAGYQAGAQLRAEGSRVTLTALYTLRQAILAGSIGAHYSAVYVGRMRDAGMDALAVIGQMQHALTIQQAGVTILAASVRHPAEVEALAALGVCTATLPPRVLHHLLDSPETAAAAAFAADARAL